MAANLTAQDIYDKEFTVDSRGYSANEVDAYLDLVIEDYQSYEEQAQKLSSALVSCDQKIRELTEENQTLRIEYNAMQQELLALRQQVQEYQSQVNSNMDVASLSDMEINEEGLSLEKRIERLERAVFPPEA
ncbi:MAG: DivIVA domain-containing protein [Allobaculum sp.]|nr:DivIVA domain-containing protein [Allobaculum sp.]